ncbi:NUDIX hydrolase [Nesterenkonia rhizosphaerae]|uniref:Nudix hydrolase domain-containing protein n=1 Tax=Nesterenkonia rhizosphaerae TaxID=1348272 RepID=A0ABP9G0I2_9MICC
MTSSTRTPDRILVLCQKLEDEGLTPDHRRATEVVSTYNNQEWLAAGNKVSVKGDGGLIAEVPSRQTARHIAQHSPQASLRTLEAKTAIVRAVREAITTANPEAAKALADAFAAVLREYAYRLGIGEDVIERAHQFLGSPESAEEPGTVYLIPAPQEQATPVDQERLVYGSTHGVPVRLFGRDMGAYTAHRLQFGEAGGGVVIFGRHQDRLAFVRHYRSAVGETLWELPRGLMEPGESPEQAAAREFTEETGHSLSRTMVISEHYADTAIYPARSTVVYGVASAEAQTRTDEEAQEVHWLDATAIGRLLAAGEIRDGHTLAALTHYFMR